MSLEEFQTLLDTKKDVASFKDFCRQKVLHGTPHVFAGKEDDFFDFKQRICAKLDIHHQEIMIVGSAKLGFSPFKRTEFSLDSDVDIAIISEKLWNEVSRLGAELEYERRSSHISMHKHQHKEYVRYLRYNAIGWVRPDLIPNLSCMKSFKQDWFDFFLSLSYGASEVGNYKVNAGVFRTVTHLEDYTYHSFGKVWRSRQIGAEAVS